MFRVAESRRQRVLDFDLENRPLSYLGMDRTSAEITAIGWSWVGETPVDTLLLQKDGNYLFNGRTVLAPRRSFDLFVEQLYAADIVTGHYIRKHDLPHINSALIENNLPPLRPLLVQDTQQDLVRRKDLSASQENLASMFGLPEAKHHMTMSEWRAANRLLPDGMKLGRKRVVDDVLQHKALRAELLKRGLLKAPRMWRG